MARFGKQFTLCLVAVLAVSSLLILDFSDAQTLTKPSVPEFSVRYADNSYNVAPRYDYDSYTGVNELVEDGYHVQNKTIRLEIKNQGFSSYYDNNGNLMRLYYIVQTRGHYGGSWWAINDGYYGPENPFIGGVSELAEAVTVLTFGLVGNNGTLGLHNLDIAEGGKADFRVQAFIGYYSETVTMTMLGASHHYDFTGEYSDWSDIQTITVSESSNANTPSPTVPEFPITTLLVAVLVASSLLMVIGKRKIIATDH